MIKKIKMLFAIGMLGLSLCACGVLSKDVDSTTVSFDKSGEVTETIIEDFSQPYYDVEELKGDISAEISAYNTQAGDAEAITLGEVKMSEEKQIRVEMVFKSYADYKAFNEKELFWGTVADAYAAGYEFTSMRDVKQDGVVLSAADVLEKGDMYMVVLEEAQQVVVPGSIRYISDGVSVIDDKRAINLNEGQSAFIIYE